MKIRDANKSIIMFNLHPNSNRNTTQALTLTPKHTLTLTLTLKHPLTLTLRHPLTLTLTLRYP